MMFTYGEHFHRDLDQFWYAARSTTLLRALGSGQ